MKTELSEMIKLINQNHGKYLLSTSITLFVLNEAIFCPAVRNIKAFNMEVT